MAGRRRKRSEHKDPFLTKKLFANDIYWERENQFSPVEWCWIHQAPCREGFILRSSWPAQSQWQELFSCWRWGLNPWPWMWDADTRAPRYTLSVSQDYLEEDSNLRKTPTSSWGEHVRWCLDVWRRLVGEDQPNPWMLKSPYIMSQHFYITHIL